MNVHESNRTRTLVIRLDRGDELPAALMRALDEAEARSAWITGTGTLEAAEIAVYDAEARPSARARKIDAPVALVSLSGNAAIEGGVLSLRLLATLARETEVGPQIMAGLLVWGRALSVELCVTALDDLALARAADDRTGLALLSGRRHGDASPPPGPVARLPQQAGSPPNAPEAPAMPQRIMRPQEEQPEAYPEAGDEVTHFHFGECTVVSSDGDRIRLRQGQDGRVREVALTMLRIGPPTVLGDGRKHFVLARKN
jgi:predicted DNA-binding protein with PD1-like motif